MNNQTPLVYTVICDRLRYGIRKKSLPPGIVLMEVPLARLFGASRSPVKQALQNLEEEGFVSRFDGRGYLVGSATTPIRRLPITRKMLGLSESTAESLRAPAWKVLFGRIERELVERSVFGQFRINELELSRHYRIGRTVAHDVLTQIQATGIVTKKDRSHWLTVPLDHKRINDLFDLRILIEPRLCCRAAERLSIGEIDAMRERLIVRGREYPKVDSDAMDDLERDLHIRILERGNNIEFFEALRRTRCILISGKHILGHGLPYPHKGDFFFDEHMSVLDALRRRDGQQAARELRSHLEASRSRVIERLGEFRIGYKLKSISFISAA